MDLLGCVHLNVEILERHSGVRRSGFGVMRETCRCGPQKFRPPAGTSALTFITFSSMRTVSPKRSSPGYQIVLTRELRRIALSFVTRLVPEVNAVAPISRSAGSLG